MIAARGHEGLAPVWEGTSAPARCAVALCTWLPAQRPCSGGRAAPRCDGHSRRARSSQTRCGPGKDWSLPECLHCEHAEQ